GNELRSRASPARCAIVGANRCCTAHKLPAKRAPHKGFWKRVHERDRTNPKCLRSPFEFVLVHKHIFRHIRNPKSDIRNHFVPTYSVATPHVSGVQVTVARPQSRMRLANWSPYGNWPTDS